MSSTKKKKMLFKILIVGDGGVGKTTLLHRYKNNQFLSDTKMTLGVDFFMKQIKMPEHTIMLQLWDFGGQQQFRHMLRNYALGASGAILVYDTTRLNTLDNIEEWIDICRSKRSDLPILLVGTKIDLDSPPIDEKYIKDISDNFKIFQHVKISSKTGENVTEVLDRTAQEMVFYSVKMKKGGK